MNEELPEVGPSPAPANVRAVKPRIKTIDSLAGLPEDAAGSVPLLLRRLRQDRAVAAADAQWEADGARLLITVESEIDGDATDADEAENFHRVWRCAVHSLNDKANGLRFDIEGSIGLPGAEAS